MLRLTYQLLLPNLLLFVIICCDPTTKNATVHPNLRVDCALSSDETKEMCFERGCIWDRYYDKFHSSVPLCYFPTKTGYVMKSDMGNGQLLLEKYEDGPKNPFGEDFQELSLNYKSIGSALKVSIGNNQRYVPSVQLAESTAIKSEDELIFKYLSSPIFSFTITRSSEQNPSSKIWDTSIGGLLFADQYIQIATYLPSDRVYGFGENVHQELKHDFTKYSTWAMLTRDDSPNSSAPNGWNYYGVHPFYIALEPSGHAHGVLIFNSNAQEVTTAPGPHLIYRTIGGQLDIYFFPGPTPEQVLQQYHQLIGKPALPPYYSLGFQLSRYGFKSPEDILATLKRQRELGIALDVAYADIDYMDRFRDFTYDHKNWSTLPNLAQELHKQGIHLILVFDPAIEVTYDVFKRALEKSVAFIEWPKDELVPRNLQDHYPMTKGSKIMLGVAWPDNHVAFPDFLDPSGRTTKWWVDEFAEFYKKVQFDGILIDMNEPSVFGTNEEKPCPTEGKDAYLDVPPYPTASIIRGKESLSSKTLCMLGETASGTLYDTHTIYGWAETVATTEALRKIMPDKRGILLSRSTFIGSGHYAGHWLGDNFAEWNDLRTSIIGVQEFNFFGIPYVGSNVCGFNYDSNEELCLRWQQLGAFHSFYRNHNSIRSADQDPARWPSVATATKAANMFRYQHLPYLYSLHFRASLYGGSVIRPVFFEFSSDSQSHIVSHQFMWGPSIMVIPVTYPDMDTVHGYLPPASEWYSISLAHKYGLPIPTGYSAFGAPRDTPLPTFVRAASIIPRQRPGMTTENSRQNEFQLLIALDPKTLHAHGEMFWDDGESMVKDFGTYNYLHFDYFANVTNDKMELVVKCTHGYDSEEKVKLPTLNTIEILGNGPVWTLIWNNKMHEYSNNFLDL
ncbi:glycosyl hydrolases family 31 domain-containing protein [Ditylenchus destructor]|uniref:Glycosyl hydrolases family 31 domain-containing protein n=1 Tax=Ditylenchus destructor TaxID=166010 RepID=A0AAD4NAD5_9BILA|nr:glycosyl hydrolases family 31 domain-containing protein [Ditylenchus destructor]